MPLLAADLPPPPTLSAPVRPQAIFSPPLGRTFTLTVTARDAFKQTQVLTLVRDLTFATEGDGFRATLTLRKATSEGHAAQRMLAGVAGFRDVPMVFHLDRSGTIQRIDSLEDLWARFCDGIAAQATGDAAQRKLAQVALDSLRDAPRSQRIAMFAGLLQPALAPHEAAQGPSADQPVATSADTSFGGGATLSGHSRAWREDDMLAIHTHIEGDARVPGASDKDASVHVVIDTDAHVDPATGLVRDRIERTSRTTDQGSRLRTIETTLR